MNVLTIILTKPKNNAKMYYDNIFEKLKDIFSDDLYLKIVSNSEVTKEEGKKNINKIISNVAKVVVKDIN